MVETAGAVNLAVWLALAASLYSLALAVVRLVRRQRTPATWFFVAGMLTLSADSLLTGLALQRAAYTSAWLWVTAALVAKALVPGVWLGFSLTYSRPDSRDRGRRWALGLGAAIAGPAAATLALRDHLFTLLPPDWPSAVWHLHLNPAAGLLNGSLLVALVLILWNLEQTFRSAVGTMRWRLKFVVLALVVILGTRLYVHSQLLLFSVPDVAALWALEAAALLVGCVLLTVAYARTGWAEVPVYPSSAVVRSSLTILITGGYLLVVGVLAQVVGRMGGVAFLQLQTLVVLVGLTGLALLLLSDRAKQRLHTFTARHFGRSQHDSVRVWTGVSEHLRHVTDAASLGKATSRLIADTFGVLSVNMWLADDTKRLVLMATTSQHGAGHESPVDDATVVEALGSRAEPFDLDAHDEAWARVWRDRNPSTFPNGGRRLCVPLRSGDEALGCLVLADRVNGTPYTVEETELLRCIGVQCTSVLLNLRLAEEVARTRELDAFRTMSTFFVHDLKNAAASLNLMLQNLPTHFDDPAFRQDALRGIGNAARRIDGIIGRLNDLRQRPEQIRIETDLNELVTEALDQGGGRAVPVSRHLEPVPKIVGDRDQLRSVVTNLVMNAHDAVGADGRIEVRTRHAAGQVMLSVSDNGCGMDEAFVRDSLFRPFQTTKSSGLGIGLFQTRTIIQAHGGQIQVDSQPGKGTTFVATFPAATAL